MRLHNFDSVFQPVSDANAAPRTAPTTSAENMDLAETNAAAKVVTPSETIREAPAGITVDQFKAKYPTLTATVVLSLQEQVTCYLVENKCWITCGSKFTIPGITSPNAKPAFLYAGGSWISDGAKD